MLEGALKQREKLQTMIEKKRKGIDMMKKLKDQIDSNDSELVTIEKEWKETEEKIKHDTVDLRKSLKISEKKFGMNYSKKSLETIGEMKSQASEASEISKNCE